MARALLGEEVQIADRAVDHLLDRDEAGLRSLMHPETTPPMGKNAVSTTFKTLPDTAPARRVILNAAHTVGGAGSETTLTYRVDFETGADGGPRASFIHIRLAAQGDAATHLAGLQVTPVPAPIYDGPADWPAGFWIALVLTPATALFCLAALVSVWRTPRLKRRILWSLFIVLIGYPIFGFSTEAGGWSLVAPSVTENGGLHVQFFQFALMSASWISSPVTGHHVFQVAVPVGALLFFLQKRRGRLALKTQTGEQNTDDSPSDTPPHPPSHPVSP